MADELKIRLDVSVYTVGDLLDLDDDGIKLVDKLRIVEKGVVEGSLRAVPLVDLPKIIEQISMEINTEANPT
jgi:hypothetical protein